MENLSRVFQNQKREKAQDTEIHKSIQDLSFTTISSCRKVSGKMSAILSIDIPST